MSDPVVERYFSTCRSLKKRFLRKPNITEARDNFYSFGKQLIVSGNKEYAVSCYMSASQCEEQLGNTVGETNALTKAAALFLELEKDKQKLCISSNEHYLAAGIDCYNMAVNKLVATNKHDLALKLCVELGCLLVDVGHIPDAEPHFIKASSLINPGNITLQIVVLKKLCYCKTYCKNYMGALETLDRLVYLINVSTSMIEEKITSHLQDTLEFCELTTLLLLLIVNTPFLHLSQLHKDLIDKYSTVPLDVLTSEAEVDRFINLVEITMATKHRDYRTLTTLHNKLYSTLDSQQNELFRELISRVEDIHLVLL